MWLAFDLGTSGVKAAILDNDERIVRSAIEPYPTHIADGGVVEQEVSDWWRALVATARVVDGEVTEIVLTGQMQDLILLNERGEPLRPAILYSDMRAQAEAVAIIERVGKERLIALTGNEQSVTSQSVPSSRQTPIWPPATHKNTLFSALPIPPSSRSSLH